MSALGVLYRLARNAEGLLVSTDDKSAFAVMEVAILCAKGFLKPGQVFAEEQTKRSARKRYIPQQLRLNLHDLANDLLLYKVTACDRAHDSHDATRSANLNFDTRVFPL